MEKRYNEEGFLIVRENHCCEHYEPDARALVPMRECWCCKWSRFSNENNEFTKESIGVCSYSGNSVETTTVS
ncbi:MAG: hypothetical protein IJR29_04330 [Butyrivibrio sp.]|nr:hypothetical protein [Butyrivibrio sp.]